MKKYELILNIVLPSILCAVVIYITNISLEYSVLSFGFIVGLINWNLHKSKPILGVLLSICASYVTFIIAFFSLYVTAPIFDFIEGGDSGKILAIIVSRTTIAPLLLFLSYSFIFKIRKTRLTIFVIILSLIVLISIEYLCHYFDFLDYKILNFYAIWQIVMALALQLIITQKT